LIALAESGYHEPVNIGNPNEFTLLELAKAVIDVTNRGREIVFEALPTDDPRCASPTSRWPRRSSAGAEGGVARRLQRTIEQSGVEAL